MKTIYSICLLLLLNLSGCATIHISSKDAHSEQPATIKFAEFNRFFIKPVSISQNLKSDYNNQDALEIIDANLYRDLLSVFDVLDNISEYDPSKPERTLIIEPSIVKMKSVGGVSRALFGVFAGGSAVVLKTTYIDAETNKVIASPSFYKHANAWAATHGNGRDRGMLGLITNAATAYAADNY